MTTYHVLGLGHTRLDRSTFSHCAFTAKVSRWLETVGVALLDRGDDVVVYWGGNELAPYLSRFDHEVIMSSRRQRVMIGDEDKIRWQATSVSWDLSTPLWQSITHSVKAALIARAQPGDVVLTVCGSNSDLVYDVLPADVTILEPWVGYVGVSSRSHGKVFESQAWRHYTYGRTGVSDPSPLDDVIPNSYDAAEFERGEDQGYLLFVGRMTQLKGVDEAFEIARRTGRRLMLAGAGGESVDDDVFTIDYGANRVDASGVDYDYVGVVGPDQRRELYAGASCTIVPTRYIEPFGGVFAEAMLSGVIPVCRRWGAFGEYVPDEFTFSDVDEAVDAVQYAVKYRHSHEVLTRATYSFSVVETTRQYLRWLERVERTRSR